jgi:hypothetical protein
MPITPSDNAADSQLKSAPHTQDNPWAEFSAGFNDRVGAPFRGAKQVASEGINTFLLMRSAEAASTEPNSNARALAEAARNRANHLPETTSKAHLAGEMVGATMLFMGTTALMRRIPNAGVYAPTLAGGALGYLEPVLPGQNDMTRITRTAEGAFSIAALQFGPGMLKKAGILQSEKAVGGALISGGLVGAVSEQSRSLVQTGHLADADRTLVAATTFGLTTGLFHGFGQALNKGVSVASERSATADRLSMKAMGQLDQDAQQGPWHLILGSGGSKAALTGTGVVIACRKAGLNLETIGGVSGGTMPAAFAAADMPSDKLLKVAGEMDIKGLVAKKPWLQQLFTEHSGSKALRQGIYDTTKLGEVTNQHVPTWPDRFWTMAVGQHSEVVISKAGMFEYSADGHRAIISGKPFSVGDAVRASSAIPGIFEAIALNGRMLFDGALGKFGKCPTDIASNHMGIPKDRIIASLPVGAMTLGSKVLYYAAKFLSGNYEARQGRIIEEAGIVIRPKVESFGSLKLDLTEAHRHEAILAGYRTTVEEFARNRVVSGAKLDELRAAGESFKTLQESVKPGKNFAVVVFDPKNSQHP